MSKQSFPIKEYKKAFGLFHNIIYISLVVLLIFEPLSKWLYWTTEPEHRVKAILKATMILIMLFFGFFYGFKKNIFYLILSLSICFIIGQLVLPSSISVFGNKLMKEFAKGDIYIFVKYISILVYVGVYEKIDDNPNLTKRIIKLFKGFMLINTFFVLLGLFSDFEFLKSYPNSERFGYQGLIGLAGESIYLYTIVILVEYFSFLRTKKVGLLAFYILGAIILGKKAIFLFLFLLLVVHLVNLKKSKLLWLTGVLLTVVILCKSFLISLFLKIFPFWNSIYEKDGMMTVVFSTRNKMLSQTISYINDNWSYVNYLLGGSDFMNFRSEFGFIDLFLVLGFIGLSIYLYFLRKYFFLNQTMLVQRGIMTIVFCDFFSGGLIINFMPILFLYLFCKHEQLIEYNKENATTIF